MGLIYRGEYANPNMVELELDQMDAVLTTLATASTASTITTSAVAVGRTLTAADSGTLFTNQNAAGSVAVILPSAVAGYNIRVYVATAQTLTVQAASGDTIRIADNETAEGGSISSNVVGSLVWLIAVDQQEWVSWQTSGSWTF